jgi:hypothetical protein
MSKFETLTSHKTGSSHVTSQSDQFLKGHWHINKQVKFGYSACHSLRENRGRRFLFGGF